MDGIGFPWCTMVHMHVLWANNRLVNLVRSGMCSYCCQPDRSAEFVDPTTDKHITETPCHQQEMKSFLVQDYRNMRVYIYIYI